MQNKKRMQWLDVMTKFWLVWMLLFQAGHKSLASFCEQWMFRERKFSSQIGWPIARCCCFKYIQYLVHFNGFQSRLNGNLKPFGQITLLNRVYLQSHRISSKMKSFHISHSPYAWRQTNSYLLLTGVQIDRKCIVNRSSILESYTFECI